MRLIDADAFKNLLNSGGSESVDININKTMPLSEIVDIVIQAYRKCLFAELEKMPTAYDVDKVVKQLEGEIKKSVLVTLKSAFKVAIDIIKAEMEDRHD